MPTAAAQAQAVTALREGTEVVNGTKERPLDWEKADDKGD
jgi:hypothetical protein